MKVKLTKEEEEAKLERRGKLKEIYWAEHALQECNDLVELRKDIIEKIRIIM